jgi:hypothetical protein
MHLRSEGKGKIEFQKKVRRAFHKIKKEQNF